MSDKSRLNLKLLKKMRKRIAEIPESYDQSHWRTPDVAGVPCGTTACLGGEAIICSEPTLKKGLDKLTWSMGHCLSPDRPYLLAQRLLGLTNEEADVMFGAGAAEWPTPFAENYAAAKNPKQRAKVAVAYLDHIIQTGQVIDD